MTQSDVWSSSDHFLVTGYGSNGYVVTAYDWHLAGFSHLGGCIFAGILKISGSQDFPFPAFHNEIHLGSGFVDFTHKSVQRTFLASKKQNKTTGKRGKELEFGVWKTPFWIDSWRIRWTIPWEIPWKKINDSIWGYGMWLQLLVISVNLGIVEPNLVFFRGANSLHNDVAKKHTQPSQRIATNQPSE